MLYVFTTTRGSSKREHFYRAMKNYRPNFINDTAPFIVIHSEYESEKTLVYNIREELESIDELGNFYYFTLSSFEFDVIRLFVKKGLVPGGAKLVVFDEKSDIIGEYAIDKDGHCEVFGDYDIFEAHGNVLSELL